MAAHVSFSRFLLFIFFFLSFFFLKDLHGRPKKPFFLEDKEKLKDWHDKEAIRRDAQRVGMEGRAECGHGVRACAAAGVCACELCVCV